MESLNLNCAGIGRRDFIQLGVGGILGLGMGDLMSLRADAARAAADMSGTLGCNRLSTELPEAGEALTVAKLVTASRVRGFRCGGVVFRWCVSFVSSGVVSCVPGCEKRG